MDEKQETTTGNGAKMREALEAFVQAYELDDELANIEETSIAYHKALEALAAPPRNCEVGTVGEQLDRYGLFCQKKCLICENRFSCHICGERYRMKCMMEWSQMPYEDGGKE